MTTERICSQILRKLKESKLTNYKVQSSIDILENHLQDNREYNREEYKEELIKDAVESNCNRFKILAVISQDFRNIFEWCDEAYNFGYTLAIPGQDKECYNKREYTLEELDSVICRALSWLESLQTIIPFYTIQLTLLAIR
jgi:hypothetical protein